MSRVCSRDVIKFCESKTKEPLKVLPSSGITVTKYIYICLQLSSSIASSVWEQAYFEFQCYGDP